MVDVFTFVFGMWRRHNLFRRSATSGSEKASTFIASSNLNRVEGQALCAMLNFGKMSGALKYCFDGGEWPEYVGERTTWVSDKDWYRPVSFADDLKPGKHHFELKVVHDNRAECNGHVCKILAVRALR